MSSSSNPISHHTSHTMGNGAKSSTGSGIQGEASTDTGHTAGVLANGAGSGDPGRLAPGSGHTGGCQAEDAPSRASLTVNTAAASSSFDSVFNHATDDHDSAEGPSTPASVASSNLFDQEDFSALASSVSSASSSLSLENFHIIDSTLREGEQFATAYFTTEQKIQIARALDDFGVEYIEVTSPAASQQSRADCEAICKLGLRAKVLCHIRCNMDDAKIAIQTGVDGINMCIGTSAQLMQHSHGKDMAYIAATAEEIIAYVRANGVEIRFSGEDSFRSDFADILELYGLMDRLGADRVGIADTVGGATPLEVYDKVRALRDAVGCDIETHFHNDTGCAIANARLALEAGATHVDTTVLGIGERNGITPLGGLVAGLMPTDRGLALSKYNLEKLADLERLVARLVGVEVPFNNLALAPGENACEG